MQVLLTTWPRWPDRCDSARVWRPSDPERERGSPAVAAELGGRGRAGALLGSPGAAPGPSYFSEGHTLPDNRGGSGCSHKTGLSSHAGRRKPETRVRPKSPRLLGFPFPGRRA